MGERFDVAVVGAGFAGLAAARALAADGLDAVVLEARDRVGGRTHDVIRDDGTVLELGGQWIGPTQSRIRGLLDELGIGTTPTSTAGLSVTVIDGEVHRHRGDLPPGVAGGAAGRLEETIDRIELLAAGIDLERPWDSPDAELLDGTTVLSWVQATVDDGPGRRFVTQLLESMFVRTAGEESMLDLLVHVRGAGTLREMLSFEGGTQEARIDGGPQAVAGRLATALGGRVRLGTPVGRIGHGRQGVELTTSSGTVAAARAIVAVPPMLAGRIAFDPPLPARREGLMQRMPHGSVIKVQLVYDAPRWRADGLSGDSFAPGSAVAETVDSSPVDARCGVLTAFVDGREARRLGALDPGARRREVVDDLAHRFGDAVRDPLEVHELDWSAEPWSLGCYSGHPVPGAWTEFGPALREPCGPIHWAGTETAIHMLGYIDGAVDSGQRAAAEVRAALG